MPAYYKDITLSSPVPVTVRWQNKLVQQGNLTGTGYAEVIDGVNRIVFGAAELIDLGLNLRPRGTVSIPAYSATFVLATREPTDGPVNVVWNVDRSA